ncbi:protease pro-enzyme activation domain-containing protein [Terriglobus tenax]|uniref:protease pro-enzyme activation domain-containing protein n=1 Tax=Terriglobus tenax TaxID=1111115 RepID=UPI0021E0759D|nr:protease pro-enzyme activation domain-containing protein [Terriglobus tenax]
MRSPQLPSVRSIALSLAALFLAQSAALFAAQPTRRIASINDGQRVSLSGNVSPRVRSAADLGEMAGNQQLEQVTLRFSMTAAQETALTQLLQDQQNPNSPRYHQWLTPEQYGAQFGMSQSDLDQATTWLTSKGLTVTEVARGKNFITVSGSVTAMESAFQTSIHTMKVGTETRFANVTEPALPASLQAVVSGITGLDNFRLKPHARPRYTSSISGSHFIAPGDLYTIYNMNSLVTGGTNGSGVTVAVMGQTAIDTTQVATFRSLAGLSTNAPTLRLYGTSPGTVTDDLGEAMLDVEWSGAAAPSASILYVYSQDVVGTSLTQTINNNLAPIISISYGLCESGWGQSALNTYNALFRQANAQGQTIVGPTGDSGATDCDYNGGSTVVTQAQYGLAVDFPASSPYVTAMGGTMFNEGSTTGATTYWSASNGTNQGSALSYIPEAVWNEYTTTYGLSGGGGGKSDYFAKPTWQTGTGVPADYVRDIPDLSLNAAASHDGYLVCLTTYCVNGYRDANSNLASYGGTSVSTPIFAGILALIEQKTGSRIGNANPTIYALANSAYSSATFHDITTGDNKMPCQSGTTDCPAGTTSIGYSATTGYDLATGWGSVDVSSLVTNWSAVSPLSSGGSSTSTTTVSTTPTNVTAGNTVTVTVSVASGTSGVTTTPTGTVQILVDGTATGSALTLSSGTASTTVATASLSSGNHTITASYTGDTTYTGSLGSATIDVVSTSTADFTLTPASTTVTVASGSTASPVTFTVASVNGFAGSISFSASTTSSNLAAQYTFSASPVTLTSGGSATTSLTLYAYSSSARSTNGLTRIASQQAKLTRGGELAAGGAVMVAGLLCFLLPRKRRLPVLLMIGFSAVLTMGMSGCTNNTASSSSSSGSSGTTNTTKGTYTITVTATSSSTSSTVTSHSSQVTFVVN